VLFRLKDTLVSLSQVESEVCGFSAAVVDLEFHEKGEGINFANVWNESLERRELAGETRVWEEEVGSTVTPSGVGGLGLMSLWVLESSFTTRTYKRKERSRHTEWMTHTRSGWQGARPLWLADERRRGRLRRCLGLELEGVRRSRTVAFAGRGGEGA